MIEIEEVRPDADHSGDPGPNASAVAGMIDRTRRLTPSQAHALAGAVAAIAETDARQAATESPGGQSIGGRWSWAEDGIVTVGVGVIGVAASTGTGQPILAAAFTLLALAGVVLLLLFESRAVTRARLLAAVDAAALAIVVRDLLDPRAFEALHGPWATVMRD